MASQIKTSQRAVALLRGINLAGRNRLPMEDLARMFETVGCSQVQTYIQSGNVVFSAAPRLLIQLPELISDAIHDQFGYTVPVVTRTAEEVSEIVGANPFLDRGAEPKTLHVAFLADLPKPESVGQLDPDRSIPDEFIVRGREIFLHLPNGVARTKLTNAYFDKKLSTTSTLRNWKTTLKLADLANPT